MIRKDLHRCILQHVGYNEKANHASADVDLIKLRNTSIAARYGDVAQSNVEVILSYKTETRYSE